MWVAVEKIKMLFFPKPCGWAGLGTYWRTFSSHGNFSQIPTDTDSSSTVQILLWFNTYVYATALKAKILTQRGAKSASFFSLNLRQRNLFCAWAKALVFSDEAKRFVLETFLLIQLQDAWRGWTPVKESDARKQMKAATWLKGIAEIGLKTELASTTEHSWGQTWYGNCFSKMYSTESTCQGAWTASFITVPLLVLVFTQGYNFFH